jgi:hypothetical protein
MAETLAALEACPWREAAADVPVALVDHDFTKASHLSDAYDAYKMTGAWNSDTQTETAFAGMAAYRFKIPSAAASVSISAVTLPLSRDRFLKGGVRVVAVLGDNATPSDDWDTIRGNNIAPVLVNEAEVLVASQPAEIERVFASSSLPELAATGKTYLWIYITLEDYTDWWDKYTDTAARQYAIEGSAMLVGGSASVTFAGAVEADSSGSSFSVCRGGVLPYLAESDRTVRSYECLAAGGDLSAPRLVVKQVTASTSALYYGNYKIRDIEGDARGVRIFASNVVYPDSDFSGNAGRNFIRAEYTSGGSSVKGNYGALRNVQYFAVLGIDGSSTATEGNYVNQIAPNVAFFMKFDVYHTMSTNGTDASGWVSAICELDKVWDYTKNLSSPPSDDEVGMVAQTYSAYLNANIAHRMLSTRRAESVSLVAGPGSLSGVNTIAASYTDITYSATETDPNSELRGITIVFNQKHTVSIGVACRVYVSGAEGVGLLGQFLTATFAAEQVVMARTTYGSTIEYVRDLSKFYVEGGEGRVCSEKTDYALYTKESFYYSLFFWYVTRRIVGRWVNEKTGGTVSVVYGYTWGSRSHEISAASETIVPFMADDSGGVLRVGEVGSVAYKGTVKGVVRYNLSPTSSALVYGEFEEVDGRPCSTYFIVTVRSNSLYVWIPPNEALGRPDTFEQFSVTNLRDDPAKVLMSGAFSSVGGRTTDANSNSIAGLCVFDMNVGTVAACAASHPSGIVSSFMDSLTIPARKPRVYYNSTLATAAQSGNYIALFASGNHMRTFRAWTAAELPVASPSVEEACIGLRNAYAKLAEGRWAAVPVEASAQPGASFAVRLASVSVPYTTSGTDEGSESVSMWHISATAALVPFSAPVGTRARAARVEWDDLDCTAGAVLNVWLKRGEYLTAMPTDVLRKPQIHDATQAEVDGWELVCSLPALASGDVTADIAPLADHVGTFLLTAYLPQDAYNPDDGDAFPMGVGTMDADALNGTVTDLASGWKPDITLIG